MKERKKNYFVFSLFVLLLLISASFFFLGFNSNQDYGFNSVSGKVVAASGNQAITSSNLANGIKKTTYSFEIFKNDQHSRNAYCSPYHDRKFSIGAINSDRVLLTLYSPRYSIWGFSDSSTSWYSMNYFNGQTNLIMNSKDFYDLDSNSVEDLRFDKRVGEQFTDYHACVFHGTPPFWQRDCNHLKKTTYLYKYYNFRTNKIMDVPNYDNRRFRFSVNDGSRAISEIEEVNKHDYYKMFNNRVYEILINASYSKFNLNISSFDLPQNNLNKVTFTESSLVNINFKEVTLKYSDIYGLTDGIVYYDSIFYPAGMGMNIYNFSSNNFISLPIPFDKSIVYNNGKIALIYKADFRNYSPNKLIYFYDLNTKNTQFINHSCVVNSIALSSDKIYFSDECGKLYYKPIFENNVAELDQSSSGFSALSIINNNLFVGEKTTGSNLCALHIYSYEFPENFSNSSVKYLDPSIFSSCINQCFSYGKKECTGVNTYTTCGNLNSDVCWESRNSSCVGNRICSNGECVQNNTFVTLPSPPQPSTGYNCTNDCNTLLSKQCINDSSYKICGQFDTDSCYDFMILSCPDNGRCQSGECIVIYSQTNTSVSNISSNTRSSLTPNPSNPPITNHIYFNVAKGQQTNVVYGADGKANAVDGDIYTMWNAGAWPGGNNYTNFTLILNRTYNVKNYTIHCAGSFGGNIGNIYFYNGENVAAVKTYTYCNYSNVYEGTGENLGDINVTKVIIAGKQAADSVNVVEFEMYGYAF